MKWAPQILECSFGSQSTLFSVQAHRCLLSASLGNMYIFIPLSLLPQFVHPIAQQLDGIVQVHVLPYKMVTVNSHDYFSLRNVTTPSC